MASATTVPRVPLGGTTVNRKTYLDVDSTDLSAGTSGAPTWIGVFGVVEFKDKIDQTMQDDSDFDSDGWKSEASTGAQWGLELKVKRAAQASTPTAYDPGQEKIRAAGSSIGAANLVRVRWYEMEPGGPRVEAYSGFASVEWSPDGGKMDDLSTVSITLHGRGKRTAITHPTLG